MALLYPCSRFLRSHETAALKTLASGLPPEWIVLGGYRLPQENVPETRDVDGVVLGDYGIFLLELKEGNVPAITGDVQNWQFGDRRPEKSPLGRLEELAPQMRNVLTRNVPGLEGWIRGRRPIDYAVLIHSTKVSLRIDDIRRCKVVLGDSWREYVLAQDRKFAKKHFPPLTRFRTAISDTLRGHKGREMPEELCGIRILEVLEEQDRCRTYRGEALSGGERIVKVYDVSGLDEEQRDLQRELARRAYDAVAQVPDRNLVVEVRDPIPTDDDETITVVHYVGDLPRLREAMGDDYVSPERKMETAALIAEGLGHLHASGVTHRNLTPDNVLVQCSSPPQVRFSEFDFARVRRPRSVFLDVQKALSTSPYLPAEALQSEPETGEYTDVFALGAILAEWFSGEPVHRDLNGETTVPVLPEGAGWKPEIAGPVRVLLAQMTRRLPDERPSAADVAIRLREAFCSQASPVQRVTPSPLVTPVTLEPAMTVEPRRFQKGDTMENGRYEVLEVGRDGGTATPYKVRDSVTGRVYLLKQIHNQDLPYELVIREFLLLERVTRNPPRPMMRVFQVNGREADYHLRLEFIEGKTLYDLKSEFPWSATRMFETLAVPLLETLAYLEDHGVAHRDISPRNIIMSPEGPILIDFGFASDVSHSGRTQVGTLDYRAPELDAGQGWHPSSDRYSLAVVLWECLCRRWPWPYSQNAMDRTPDKQSLDPDPDWVAPEARRMLTVLRRALDPDPENRFAGSRAFLTALQQAYTTVQSEQLPVVPLPVSAVPETPPTLESDNDESLPSMEPSASNITVSAPVSTESPTVKNGSTDLGLKADGVSQAPVSVYIKDTVADVASPQADALPPSSTLLPVQRPVQPSLSNDAPAWFIYVPASSADAFERGRANNVWGTDDPSHWREIKEGDLVYFIHHVRASGSGRNGTRFPQAGVDRFEGWAELALVAVVTKAVHYKRNRYLPGRPYCIEFMERLSVERLPISAAALGRTKMEALRSSAMKGGKAFWTGQARSQKAITTRPAPTPPPPRRPSVPATRNPATDKLQINRSNIVALLRQAGFKVIDNRSVGGALWVNDGAEIRPVLKALGQVGLHFKLCAWRKQWWLTS